MFKFSRGEAVTLKGDPKRIERRVDALLLDGGGARYRLSWISEDDHGRRAVMSGWFSEQMIDAPGSLSGAANL